MSCRGGVAVARQGQHVSHGAQIAGANANCDALNAARNAVGTPLGRLARTVVACDGRVRAGQRSARCISKTDRATVLARTDLELAVWRLTPRRPTEAVDRGKRSRPHAGPPGRPSMGGPLRTTRCTTKPALVECLPFPNPAGDAAAGVGEACHDGLQTTVS